MAKTLKVDFYVTPVKLNQSERRAVIEWLMSDYSEEEATEDLKCAKTYSSGEYTLIEYDNGRIDAVKISHGHVVMHLNPHIEK